VIAGWLRSKIVITGLSVVGEYLRVVAKEPRKDDDHEGARPKHKSFPGSDFDRSLADIHPAARTEGK
jgi:hypothetical protein